MKLNLQGVLFFSIFFFVSCSTPNSTAKNSIEINSNFYISTGTGESEKEAIAEALERLASSLSSKVSSVFNLHKKSSSNKYQKTSEHDIKIEVEKIKFSYRLLSSNKQNNRYFITLKVDRQESAKRYVIQLQRTLKKIDNELELLSSLKKYLFLKQYPFHKLYYTLDIILMIDSNNSSFSRLENGIKLLEKEQYQHQKELTFSVESKSDYLRDMVINMLIDEKFNISSNAKIKLTVNFSNIETDEIYGEYYAQSSAVVNMIKNQEIITKIIPLVAKPSSNEKGANKNIIKAFEKAFPKFIKKEFR